MREFLSVIAQGDSLTEDQAAAAMHVIMRGESTAEETAGFLMGLRSRGETIDELVGFTRVMRAYAVKVELTDPDAIDVCGTGGDNSGFLNVSTAAALVCAGAGITVAKHGNRSVSSRSGSSDVLAALGVETSLGPRGVEHCLAEAGVAFIFAPLFHPALKHVMPVRRTLGVRTFFNVLGPLCNPAGVQRQLVGAFSEEVARMMAMILKRLGAVHVMAVHSEDGLDEISLSAPTLVYEWRRSDLDQTNDPPAVGTVNPAEFGLKLRPRSVFVGGDAEENARRIGAILDGADDPAADMILLNAAAAMVVAGRVDHLSQGIRQARTSIVTGSARDALNRLRIASKEAAEAEATG